MTEDHIVTIVLLGVSLIGIFIITIMEIRHRRANKDRFRLK